MPAHQVSLPSGRSTQRHNELPRRRLRLQPEYYIKRDTGEFVPLVPADELPLEFHGLPRSLSSVENSRMIFLGQKGPWAGYYRMKQPGSSVSPEQPGAQNGSSSNTEGHKISRESSSDSTGKRPAPDHAAFNTTVNTQSKSAASPVRSRSKELCYSWIRGHCKYASNCHRLHQMPETTEEWQDIVLHGVFHKGLNPRGVDSPQKSARHNKPQSELDVLNREIVFLRQALANQSNMRKARHQKVSRAGVRDIEVRLIQKVLSDKDAKRNLDRETEPGRAQGEKDAAPTGKERKEGNGSQATASQPAASTTEGVRTGRLVDVK